MFMCWNHLNTTPFSFSMQHFSQWLLQLGRGQNYRCNTRPGTLFRVQYVLCKYNTCGSYCCVLPMQVTVVAAVVVLLVRLSRLAAVTSAVFTLREREQIRRWAAPCDTSDPVLLNPPRLHFSSPDLS
jgi:hypothetical protein